MTTFAPRPIEMRATYESPYQTVAPISLVDPSGSPTGQFPVAGGGGATGGGAGSGGVRDAINRSFDTKITGLRDLLNAAPRQQQQMELKVQNMFNSNLGGLRQARDSGIRNIQAARDRTQRDLDTGERRLGEVGRNALRGFNNQLGTFGAADSSAAFLGSEAIGRDQARLRSDLFNEAQDRFTQLDVTRQGVLDDFNLQMNELNTWKNNNMIDIAREYEDLQRQINQEISVADSDRQLALAELSQEIASSAASRIAQVQQEYQTAANTLASRVPQGPQVNAQRLSVQPTMERLAVGPTNVQGAIVTNANNRSANRAAIPMASGGLQSRNDFDGQRGLLNLSL